MSERFTAPELSKLYPQAGMHTQWPGKGVAGDPVFDQFFASQVEDMSNLVALEDLNRSAGIALLDKIGPKGMGHGHSFKGMFRNVSAGPTMSNNRLFAGMNRILKWRCAKKSADHQN